MEGPDLFLTMIFPFACVFMRTMGFFVTAPILGARYIPGQVKVGASLITAYSLWNLVPYAGIPANLLGWAVALLGEIACGLFMGFCSSILLSAVEMAGHVVDIEIGFGLSNVIDPQLGSTAPLMGTFQYLLIAVLFMMMDGHHILLREFIQSFSAFSAGAAAVPSAWAGISVATAGRMFLIAAILSCPIWASMLITDVAMGVVARSVPQFNIFVVGMPLKSLVGFAVMAASLGFYGAFSKELAIAVRGVIQSLVGGAAP